MILLEFIHIVLMSLLELSYFCSLILSGIPEFYQFLLVLLLIEVYKLLFSILEVHEVLAFLSSWIYIQWPDFYKLDTTLNSILKVMPIRTISISKYIFK